MSARFAELTARIEGMRQLDTVVNAMRGIAGTRAQQARAQLPAVQSHAETLLGAIAQILPLLEPPQSGESASGETGLVLFLAEQGFAGAFSERLLDALATDDRQRHIFIIGTRGAEIAQEHGIIAEWTGVQTARAAGSSRLADQVATALYRSIAEHDLVRVDMIFGRWPAGSTLEIARRQLFPLDLDALKLPKPGGNQAPLLNLSPDALLSSLTAEYVHARLCRAALESFAAESEARMLAMTSARREIDKQLEDLEGERRRARQDEITAEIIELGAARFMKRV